MIPLLMTLAALALLGLLIILVLRRARTHRSSPARHRHISGSIDLNSAVKPPGTRVAEVEECFDVGTLIDLREVDSDD